MNKLLVSYDSDSDSDDKSVYSDRDEVCDSCDITYKHLEKDCPHMYEMLTYQYNNQFDVKMCKFCKQTGHLLKDCPTLAHTKTKLCAMCGLAGHLPSKCNKIKIGPSGQVGFCTYNECKKDDRWGHWMVNCPRRYISQGEFEFPIGSNVRKALEWPPRMRKN